MGTVIAEVTTLSEALKEIERLQAEIKQLRAESRQLADQLTTEISEGERDGYNLKYAQEIQEKVIRLYNEGKTGVEITEATGLSKVTVYALLNVNGIELDRVQVIDQERKGAILQEALKGEKTLAQIAEEYGVSRPMVSLIKTDYLKATGQYPPKRSPQIADRNRKIIELYLNKVINGLTNQQIAEINGCSLMVVNNVIKEYRREQRAQQAGTN